MTDTTLMGQLPDTLEPDPEALVVSRYRSRLRPLFDPSSPLLTYVGVAVSLIGFALLGLGWADVAGLTEVWKQMPYLLSAGLPGLGLVMTGLVIVNVSARRQDAAARARQTAILTEALRTLQRTLDR